MKKRLLAALPVLLCDAAGIAGAALCAYGAATIYLPAGFITGGMLLLAGAWLAGRQGQADKEDI